MKFRIKETQDGHRFEIQYKRKYWFWIGARDYANHLRYFINDRSNSDFNYFYYTYKEAKADLDKLLGYKTEAYKRKTSNKRIHDEVDFDSEKDRFLIGL